MLHVPTLTNLFAKGRLTTVSERLHAIIYNAVDFFILPKFSTFPFVFNSRIFTAYTCEIFHFLFVIICFVIIALDLFKNVFVDALPTVNSF